MSFGGGNGGVMGTGAYGGGGGVGGGAPPPASLAPMGGGGGGERPPKRLRADMGGSGRGGPPGTGGGRVVLIRNLPTDCRDDEITPFCLAFGGVVAVFTLRNKFQSFVEFATLEAATAFVNHHSAMPLVVRGQLCTVTMSVRDSVSPSRQPIPQSDGDAGPGRVVLCTFHYSRGVQRYDINSLYYLFATCGHVRRIVKFMKRGRTGGGGGVPDTSLKALVEFEKVEAAVDAKVKLDGTILSDGANLSVGYSRLPEVDIKTESDSSRDFTVTPPRPAPLLVVASSVEDEPPPRHAHAGFSSQEPHSYPPPPNNQGHNYLGGGAGGRDGGRGGVGDRDGGGAKEENPAYAAMRAYMKERNTGGGGHGHGNGGYSQYNSSGYGGHAGDEGGYDPSAPHHSRPPYQQPPNDQYTARDHHQQYYQPPPQHSQQQPTQQRFHHDQYDPAAPHAAPAATTAAGRGVDSSSYYAAPYNPTPGYDYGSAHQQPNHQPPSHGTAPNFHQPPPPSHNHQNHNQQSHQHQNPYPQEHQYQQSTQGQGHLDRRPTQSYGRQYSPSSHSYNGGGGGSGGGDVASSVRLGGLDFPINPSGGSGNGDHRGGLEGRSGHRVGGRSSDRSDPRLRLQRPPSPSIPSSTPGRVVAVHNLAEGVVPNDLFVLFGLYGNVVCVRIAAGAEAPEAKEAFVEFTNDEGPRAAVAHLQDAPLLGRPLRVVASDVVSIRSSPPSGSGSGSESKAEADAAENDKGEKHTTQEFDDSALHRPRTHFENVAAPASQLHLSGLTQDITEEDVRGLFGEGPGGASKAEEDGSDGDKGENDKPDEGSAAGKGEGPDEGKGKGGETKISEVRFITPEGRRFKMAIAVFSSIGAAVNALVKADGTSIRGCVVRVSFAKERTKRRGGGGMRGMGRQQADAR